MFDIGIHLDELRSWPTDRLVAHHGELVREVRRLQLEDLDVLRVLDERGKIDTSVGRDGESARTVAEKVETARALESLPAVAAAAHAGTLSDEQLTEVVKVADAESDAEWAARAPNMTPADLGRMARTKSKPTVEHSRARHAARTLWTRWDRDRGMLQVRAELPDVMGAKFEETMKGLVEAMRPAKGQPWERRDRRAADALLQMCDAVAVAARVAAPQLAAKPAFFVDIARDGPAEVAGIPLPDAIVEQLRAGATIDPVLVDADGAPVAVGKRTSGLSPKVARAVMLRDGHCRCGGCDLQYGLQAHHLRPRSWGGSDEPSNLAMVASVHHPLLIPHGPFALVGNPNRPDGLRMVHVAELTEAEAEQVGLPPPRPRRRGRPAVTVRRRATTRPVSTRADLRSVQREHPTMGGP
jgi:hypothetical protein